MSPRISYCIGVEYNVGTGWRGVPHLSHEALNIITLFARDILCDPSKVPHQQNGTRQEIVVGCRV